MHFNDDDDDDDDDKVGGARVISQSLSALTATDSSDGGVPVSIESTATSHGSSAELLPVRDVAPAEAETGATDGRLSERAPHHGSMTFIVDFSDSAGGRVRPGGAPLSECVPPRLRRKSVQHRTERDERDEERDRDKDNDAEVLLALSSQNTQTLAQLLLKNSERYQSLFQTCTGASLYRVPYQSCLNQCCLIYLVAASKPIFCSMVLKKIGVVHTLYSRSGNLLDTT